MMVFMTKKDPALGQALARQLVDALVAAGWMAAWTPEGTLSLYAEAGEYAAVLLTATEARYDQLESLLANALLRSAVLASPGQQPLALVGAPQSGKSTFLRALLLSAMLTHTPAEAQFLCLDFGGGSLQPFEQAPHVSGVAGRHDPTRARRALAEVRLRLDGAGYDAIEYIEVRDADTLKVPPQEQMSNLRILAAVRVGRTRLIDNVGV